MMNRAELEEYIQNTYNVEPDYPWAKYPEDECPVAVETAKHIINLPTHYPRTKLQPARKIIEKHLIKGEEK